MSADNKVIFTIEDFWNKALEKTDKGLIPLAVSLIDIPDNLIIPVDGIPFAANYSPTAVVCMTTVFSDEDFNGKWGWYALTGELKQVIGELIQDKERCWYFLSQKWGEL